MVRQHLQFCGVSSRGRPWSPLSVRLTFWEGLDAGLAVAVAARAAGLSRPTAYRWLSDHQKVLPSPVPNFSVPRAGLLSLGEREEIGFQVDQGHGVRHIAAILGRAPSTISREIARNRFSDRYSPSLAQEQTWARAHRPKPRKLDGLASRDKVTKMLTDRFSPEQVAGRLKVEHPENLEMQGSHGTIYQALYVQGRGSVRREVATTLRSGRVRRGPQRPEGPRPQRFQEMVMISDRPAEFAASSAFSAILALLRQPRFFSQPVSGSALSAGCLLGSGSRPGGAGASLSNSRTRAREPGSIPVRCRGAG